MERSEQVSAVWVGNSGRTRMVGSLICSNGAIKGRAALQAMNEEDDFFVQVKENHIINRKIEKCNTNLETGYYPRGNEALGSPCTRSTSRDYNVLILLCYVLILLT